MCLSHIVSKFYLSKESYLNTTLLVANLAASVDASGLEEMFTIIGNVRSARIVHNKDTGNSKGSGVGYVEMSTREELEDCILYFASQSPNDGKSIMVREYIPHVPKPL